MTDDFREAVLRAKANHDGMTREFAGLLRELLRAVSAVNDPSNAIYNARVKLEEFVEIAKRVEGHIPYGEVISAAVREVADTFDEDSHEAVVRRAALAGMSYYAELTAVDNAAAARSATKQRAFLDAIDRIERARRRLPGAL